MELKAFSFFCFVFNTIIVSIHGGLYCAYESIEGKWQQRVAARLCCDVSTTQWEVIAWYLKRVNSYIDVTEVIREEKQVIKIASTFSTDFSRDLYKYTGIDCYAYRVDYLQKDEMIDKSDPHAKAYKWHAELSKNNDSETYVMDTCVHTIRRTNPSKSMRTDEPDNGSIILTHNIEILDSYLNGESRHPFLKKRAHYIILVYKSIDEKQDFDKLASSVMTKLWIYHGILNAIILSSCRNETVR